MADIYVDVHGRKIQVTKEKLFEMARMGLITPETRIWNGYAESTAGRVKNLKFGDSQVSPVSTPTPTSPATVDTTWENPLDSTGGTDPFAGFSDANAEPIHAEIPTGPVNIPVGPPAPAYEVKPKKSGWGVVSWLLAGAGLVIFICVVVLGVFMISRSVQNDIGKPKTETAAAESSPAEKTPSEPAAPETASAEPAPAETAASEKPPQSQIKMTTDSGGFLTSSFDRNIETLPSEFMGHRVVDIILKSGKAFAPKDEFETTADYRVRIEKAPDTILFGSVTSKSTFAVRAYYKSVFRYDADRQIATIDLNHNMLRNLDQRNVIHRYADQLCSLVLLVDSDHDTDDGKTSFFFGLMIVLSRPAENFPIPLRPILINLSPEKARAAKESYKILCVFETEPLDELIDNPDVTPILEAEFLPKDSETENFSSLYIYSKNIEFWVYNGETGEVYQKCPMSDLLGMSCR